MIAARIFARRRGGNTRPAGHTHVPETRMAIAIDLRGHVAVVTGGGRGLGRAFAQALAAAGCSVAVIARSAAELAETVRLIAASGGLGRAFTADVTDPSAVVRAFTEIEQQL